MASPFETWDAVRVVGQATAGRTKPLLLECVRQSQWPESPQETRANLYVKLLGLPEVDENLLFRELAGNLLARRLGVSAARSGVVHVPAVLAAPAADQPTIAKPGASVIGIGSEACAPGARPVTPNHPFSPPQIADAVGIYAFDLLVQNPDRRPENPNCLALGNRLVAFDFEMCFSFLLALPGSVAAAWRVADHEIAEKHLFKRTLTRQETDWHPFVSAVADLDLDEIQQAMDRMPFSQPTTIARIAQHLADVTQYVDDFESHLGRSLQ